MVLAVIVIATPITALLLLSNVIARETRHYLYENRLDHHASSQDDKKDA